MVGALGGALEGALATPGEQLSEESEAERSRAKQSEATILWLSFGQIILGKGGVIMAIRALHFNCGNPLGLRLRMLVSAV